MYIHKCDDCYFYHMVHIIALPLLKKPLDKSAAELSEKEVSSRTFRAQHFKAGVSNLRTIA